MREVITSPASNPGIVAGSGVGDGEGLGVGVGLGVGDGDGLGGKVQAASTISSAVNGAMARR
jgi:hypothetical protein